jgi:hypothetical protein
VQTIEIPTHEWVPFLNDFSKRHQGEPVTVEISAGDAQTTLEEARAMPLVGVSVDLKEGEREQIEVLMGGRPRADLMHAVTQPHRVLVERTENGDDCVLRIDSEDGSCTTVKLQ